VLLIDIKSLIQMIYILLKLSNIIYVSLDFHFLKTVVHTR